MDKKPKIYRMNDFDTVIAWNKKQAIEHYFYEEYPDDDIETVEKECCLERNLNKGFWWMSNEKEITDKINKLENYGDEIKVGRWACEICFWVTFKEVINKLLDRVDIPGIICSTEY